MSELLVEHEDLEDIIKLIFKDNYRIVEKMGVSFHCPCSKYHFAGGIASLGKEEINNILETDKKAEVVCHYCGNSYEYNEDDLKKILKGAK